MYRRNNIVAIFGIILSVRRAVRVGAAEAAAVASSFGEQNGARRKIAPEGLKSQIFLGEHAPRPAQTECAALSDCLRSPVWMTIENLLGLEVRVAVEGLSKEPSQNHT